MRSAQSTIGYKYKNHLQGSPQNQPVTKTLLAEVYKLLRLYLTLPVALATSKCTFSAL